MAQEVTQAKRLNTEQMAARIANLRMDLDAVDDGVIFISGQLPKEAQKPVEHALMKIVEARAWLFEALSYLESFPEELRQYEHKAKDERKPVDAGRTTDPAEAGNAEGGK